MNRRTFLAGGATLFSAITGGCMTFNAGEREGVILTHVELGNARDEPQSFDVLVTHDEQIIHWSQREVEAGGGAVIGIDSPGELGVVEVLVRVNGERARTDFDSDDFAGERVIAVITYGKVDDEMLRISRVVSDRPTATGD